MKQYTFTVNARQAQLIRDDIANQGIFLSTYLQGNDMNILNREMHQAQLDEYRELLNTLNEQGDN